MKKMSAVVLAVVVAIFGFGPVQARDAVWVYVGGYGGDKQRVDGIDLDSLSVCEFKAQMASRFGLDSRKFDVKRSSQVLDDGGSMQDAGVRQNANVHLVSRNTNSQQCR